jgi:hypothetical protein
MQRCGHLPQVERPQEFNRVVIDFLSDRQDCVMNQTPSGVNSARVKIGDRSV